MYGIGTFRKLFNDHQLHVLGSLCEASPQVPAVAAKRGLPVTVRQEERLHAPFVPPRRCPLFVRDHCYASTHGDTS